MNIKELVSEIQENPEKFVPIVTFDNVVDYIINFIYAKQVCKIGDADNKSFLGDFALWVCSYFNMNLKFSGHWDKVVYLNSDSDGDALRKLFILVHEFYEARNSSNESTIEGSCVNIRELFLGVQRRPGMFVPIVSYESIISYVNNFVATKNNCGIGDKDDENFLNHFPQWVCKYYEMDEKFSRHWDKVIYVNSYYGGEEALENFFLLTRKFFEYTDTLGMQ